MILILNAGLGAVIGAVLRYAITNFGKRNFSSSFPYATLLINLTGTFMLGLLFALKTPIFIYALVGTGILGGYTTFSTLNVELLALLNNKKYSTFLGYLLISYGGGLLLIYLGYIIGIII